MKVTALVENAKAQDARALTAKHGLSLLIEALDRVILFDLGPDRTYLKNAARMGIDLARVNDVVISHGHVDHIGGLPSWGELAPNAAIYLSQKAFEPYWIKVGPFFKGIGLKQEKVAGLADRMHFLTANTTIAPGIDVVMCGATVAHHAPNDAGNLYKGAKKVPDTFDHELALVIKGDGELTVFSGCSHNGIERILDIVQAQYEEKIKAVVGGFHMIGLPYVNNLGKPKAEIEKTAGNLAARDVGTYYSCHCTGPKAFALMKPILGAQLASIRTGETIEV